MFKRIAAAISQHPVTVVVLAVLLLAGAGLYGTTVFSRLTSQGFFANGSQSAAVYNGLQNKFSHLDPDVFILIKSKPDSGNVGSVKFDSAAQKVLRKVADTRGVASVTSYYSTGSNMFVSDNHRETYATVYFESNVKDSDKLAHTIRDEVTSGKVDALTSGQTLMTDDITGQISKDLSKAETISFIILAVLLVLVFRSVIAAAVPLILGGFSILISFLLLRFLSDFTTVSEYAINVIIALGLGLSIDYSLLIVSRFREELVRQKTVKKALLETIHTAGHTVFFSGFTVIISLLALSFFPIAMLRSMGLGGASAVVAALIAGLIVLPAILTLLGHRINSLAFGSFRRDVRAGKLHAPPRFWYHLTRVTMVRPAIAVVIVLAFLVICGLPILHLQTSSVDERSLPPASPSRQVLSAVKHDFPGSSTASLEIIYQTHNLSSPDSIGKLYDYTVALSKLPHVTSVSGLTALTTGSPSELSKSAYQMLIDDPSHAPPAIRSQITRLQRDNSTVITVNRSDNLSLTDQHQIVTEARNLPVPAGASVEVGGEDALSYDQLAAIKARAPYAVAWIVIVICLLMFLMLGSIILPIKAMLLNALSLSVAVGAVTWVFQGGHLAHLFGFNSSAGIDITEPMIILAIAFGLSMDYSVFLYGRIKEEHLKHNDTKKAVAEGLTKTGGIITSAAILLFVVVAAFATSGVAVMQQIGFGLAVAVLVDAFIVRLILVPSTMALLGDICWWAPRGIKKLYHRLNLDR